MASNAKISREYTNLFVWRTCAIILFSSKICAQTRVPSELKQLRFCAKRKLAYKKNKWTLSAVSFSPYSLLSMAEGGWLKMPPKRKFRELKTADEEKALLEKSVPKSTRYVTKWSFNIFAQWQNARLNKHAANEEAAWVRRGTGQNPKSRYEHF